MMKFTDPTVLPKTMRFPLFSPLIAGGLLCLAATATHAQQQESRIEQILHPDPNRVFDYGKSSKDGKAFNSKPLRGSAPMDQKPSGIRNFNTSDYLTGAFHDQKTCWMGDFKYSLDEKKSSRFLFLFPSSKTYKTQVAATKDFQDQKKFKDAAASTPTRDFRGKEREKLKQHLTPEQAANNGYRGDLYQLKSIDDVRALLNKSK